MNKVLIKKPLIEKAIRRFERKPGADIVPFDRIPGQPHVHFSIASKSVCSRPSAYSSTEEVDYGGNLYYIFLPDTIAIART